MGFFSFKLSDTKESLYNYHSDLHTECVKMIDDKGNEWFENYYDGYGLFCGKDFFELVAEMNEEKTKKLLSKFDDKRSVGTHLYYNCDDVLLPKIVTKDCNKKYNELDDVEDCPNQGYFYNADEYDEWSDKIV